MPNESESEKPQIELASDEEWKERVKAEDAQLDQQSQSGSESKGSNTTAAPDVDELPPANFSAIVQIFVVQAFGALGMFPGPDGKPAVQLPVAKHLIDLLGVLEEKTKGNLSNEEIKNLDEALHEMRMAYVHIAQQSRQSPKS